VVKGFWLIPLRDLFGFAVWLGGLSGHTVYWRDRELRLHHDGRIQAEAHKPEPIYHH
jgi:ceramide glucosyltransferase